MATYLATEKLHFYLTAFCNDSILYTHTQQETKMDNDEKSEIKAVLGIALLITMAIVGLISEAL